MAEDILQQVQRLNQLAEGFKSKTHTEILLEIQSMGISDKGKLLKSIKNRVGYRSGVADRVTINMRRYGYFRAKGVGRGTTISQVGSTNRTPAPFISNVLDRNTPQFADQVAEIFADSAVKSIKF